MVKLPTGIASFSEARVPLVSYVDNKSRQAFGNTEAVEIDDNGLRSGSVRPPDDRRA